MHALITVVDSNDFICNLLSKMCIAFIFIKSKNDLVINFLQMYNIADEKVVFRELMSHTEIGLNIS